MHQKQQRQKRIIFFTWFLKRVQDVQSINLYLGIERNINSASDFSKEYFFDIVMIQEICYYYGGVGTKEYKEKRSEGYKTRSHIKRPKMPKKVLRITWEWLKNMTVFF